MSFRVLADSLGWIAIVLGLWGTYVQYRRVIRQGVEGVSLATWTLFAFMGCFWIAYGFVVHSIVIISGSVVIWPFQVGIVYRLKPWRAWGTIARSFAYAAICCAMTTILWGWQAGVYGTGVAMAINRGPQIVKLIRHADGTGVSVATWALGATGALCWVIYYESHGLWAPLVATAFAGTASLTIAVLALWRHRQVLESIETEVAFARG